MILLSYFILMIKKVTAHQQKVRFFGPPCTEDPPIRRCHVHEAVYLTTKFFQMMALTAAALSRLFDLVNKSEVSSIFFYFRVLLSLLKQ